MLAPSTVLEISAASIQGPQLQLQNLRIRAQGRSPQQLHWQLRGGKLQGAGALHWQAASAQGQTADQHGHWQLRLQSALQGTELGNLQLQYQGNIDSTLQYGQMRGRVQGKELGLWQIRGSALGRGGWRAQLAGNGPANLIARQFLPANWQPQGNFAAQLTARGATLTKVSSVGLQLALRQFQFASPSGLQAAQNGQLDLDVTAKRRRGAWEGQAQLHCPQGALLWSPWYVSVGSSPLRLQGDWRYTPTGWQVTQAQLHWPQLGDARFALRGPMGRAPLTVDLEKATLALGPLWQIGLRPLLPNTGLAHRLQAQGRLQLSGRYAGGLQALQWQLSDGGLRDPEKQFALHDLRSLGRWQRGAGASQAQLQWLYGRFYDIPFGPLDARFLLRANAAQLTTPAAVSVLGGRLQIERLRANWQGNSPSFVLGGAIRQIQLGSLTHTFGWPHFTGRLSAVIPRLLYHNGNLVTDSVLHADAFGGTIDIHGLQLDGLFGPSPLLKTNIDLRGLQLKPLTDVFPVGYISGVLDGKIEHLTLLNWQPVAFDARIATRKNPKISQKISAAAIEKLTRLGGGGISGFVQNIYLRFFREFGYAQLGAGVRLQDGIAHLSGVANAPHGGFYLLKGQGVPQVNIIGYNRRSNWQELLSRLRAVMEGKTPVATGD
ncbi:MAG: hypothetical protein JJ714_07165 [Acidithiobacillus sp.]|nr:hypothetical protein [Acidithiobacillus sp.]